MRHLNSNPTLKNKIGRIQFPKVFFQNQWYASVIPVSWNILTVTENPDYTLPVLQRLCNTHPTIDSSIKPDPLAKGQITSTPLFLSILGNPKKNTVRLQPFCSKSSLQALDFSPGCSHVESTSYPSWLSPAFPSHHCSPTAIPHRLTE